MKQKESKILIESLLTDARYLLIIEHLKSLQEINYNATRTEKNDGFDNEYFQGIHNGMEMMIACMSDQEPKFKLLKDLKDDATKES